MRPKIRALIVTVVAILSAACGATARLPVTTGTASLGLAYSTGGAGRYGPGMFVGQHGSWNRQPRSGHKVIFVPFANGAPSGQPLDVLTGFLDERDGDSRGRPVGVVLDRHNALLVADDVGNVIWRVSGATGS